MLFRKYFKNILHKTSKNKIRVYQTKSNGGAFVSKKEMNRWYFYSKIETNLNKISIISPSFFHTKII